MQEKKNKDYSKRIEALTEYLSQELPGQEEAIKLLLLFAISERKINFDNRRDEALKNKISNRVASVFKEFYTDNNFSIKTKGEELESLTLPEIPTDKFLDFVTYDSTSKISLTEEQKTLLFSNDEVDKMQSEIKKIALSECVKAFILRYRHEYCDSYWQDLVHVLQTSAFLNGRGTVYLADCFSFQDLSKKIGQHDDLWDEEYCYNEYVKENDIPELLNEFINFIRDNCSKTEKESSALKTIKEKLNTYYSSITKKIDDSIVRLQNYKLELEENNIFKFNSDSKDNYTSFFEKSIDNLQRTKDLLKEKYEKVKLSFVKNLKLGDCISLSGEVVKDEFNIKGASFISFDDMIVDSGSQISAVICIIGDDSDSIYGIAPDYCEEKNFTEAEEIAKTYKGKKNSVYTSGWKIPDIGQLEQICINREKLDLPDDMLKGKVWSSTKKDDNAVYFYDFDKGTKDYTTTDHKYKLVLIHKFGE